VADAQKQKIGARGPALINPRDCCSQFLVIDRDHDAIAQCVRYLEFLRSLHDRRDLVFGVDMAEVSRRRSPYQAGAPSMLKVALRGFSGLGHLRPPVPLATDDTLSNAASLT
jgi:hypothetical protein